MSHIFVDYCKTDHLVGGESRLYNTPNKREIAATIISQIKIVNPYFIREKNPDSTRESHIILY